MQMATTEATGRVGRVRVEQGAKRVRAYLGGELVADTIRPRLVWEVPYYPAYYVPLADVRTDLLVATATVTHSPSRGQAQHFAIIRRRPAPAAARHQVQQVRERAEMASPTPAALIAARARAASGLGRVLGHAQRPLWEAELGTAVANAITRMPRERRVTDRPVRRQAFSEGRRRQQVRPARPGGWRGMSWLNAGLAAGLVQHCPWG
jgi:uncharacterized protein (DUF427 family)